MLAVSLSLKTLHQSTPDVTRPLPVSLLAYLFTPLSYFQFVVMSLQKFVIRWFPFLLHMLMQKNVYTVDCRSLVGTLRANYELQAVGDISVHLIQSQLDDVIANLKSTVHCMMYQWSYKIHFPLIRLIHILAPVHPSVMTTCIVCCFLSGKRLLTPLMQEYTPSRKRKRHEVLSSPDQGPEEDGWLLLYYVLGCYQDLLLLLFIELVIEDLISLSQGLLFQGYTFFLTQKLKDDKQSSIMISFRPFYCVQYTCVCTCTVYHACCSCGMHVYMKKMLLCRYS